MYWYYKYPFLLLCLLVIFGIGYVVWTKLPADMTGSSEPEEMAPESQQDPNRDRTGSATPDLNDADDPDSKEQRLPRQTDNMVDKQLDAAREQLKRGKLLAARALAQKALERQSVKRFEPRWNQAAEIISQVNTRLVNSDIPCPEKQRYEIKSGDKLVTIARQFNTTVAALQRSNPVLPRNDDTIYPGTTLSIYTGDWRVEVYKPERVLILMDGDTLFKLYPVAIGRQGRTPEGEFVIKNRQFHPDWTPPGRHIPYGDPENVLGTHWLGLRPVGDTDPTLSGYGIHGTWEPESIGSEASLGCIRMKNEAVEELYDIVRTGTKVIIKGE